MQKIESARTNKLKRKKKNKVKKRAIKTVYNVKDLLTH